MTNAPTCEATAANPDGFSGGRWRVERLLGDRFRMAWFDGRGSEVAEHEARVTLMRLAQPTGAVTLSLPEHGALLETFAWWAESRLHWQAYEEPKWRELASAKNSISPTPIPIWLRIYLIFR